MRYAMTAGTGAENAALHQQLSFPSFIDGMHQR